MVSTHAAVHIGGGDFMTVHPMFGNKPIEDIQDHVLPNTKTALDQLLWWTKATMAANGPRFFGLRDPKTGRPVRKAS